MARPHACLTARLRQSRQASSTRSVPFVHQARGQTRMGQWDGRQCTKKMRRCPYSTNRGAPIAVLMSDENLLFANRLSNRLACTKAAALEPPWPAPHAKACTVLPRAQVLANKKTAMKACCCKPRSAGAHHQKRQTVRRPRRSWGAFGTAGQGKCKQ